MSYNPKNRPNAVKILKHYEGFRENAYVDTAGHVTIGYGCRTWFNRQGQPDVVEGETITESEAVELMSTVLSQRYPELSNLFNNFEALNDNQKDALLSMTYCGMGNFKSCGKTIISLINNNPNDPKLKDAFGSFRVTQKNEFNDWLASRRACQYKLYSEGVVDFNVPFERPDGSIGTGGVTSGNTDINMNSVDQVQYVETNYCYSIACIESSNVSSGGGGGGTAGEMVQDTVKDNSSTEYGGNLTYYQYVNLYKSFDSNNLNFDVRTPKFVRLKTTIEPKTKPTANVRITINNNSTYGISITPSFMNYENLRRELIGDTNLESDTTVKGPTYSSSDIKTKIIDEYNKKNSESKFAFKNNYNKFNYAYLTASKNKTTISDLETVLNKHNFYQAIKNGLGEPVVLLSTDYKNYFGEYLKSKGIEETKDNVFKYMCDEMISNCTYFKNNNCILFQHLKNCSYFNNNTTAFVILFRDEKKVIDKIVKFKTTFLSTDIYMIK